MRIIDPHMHMVSRSADDYRRARRAGIECCIEPAFWSGQDKHHAGAFFDYFEQIIEHETDRAERAGMDHYVTIGLEPKEANYREMAEEVVDRIPEYLERDPVVGVGEIGFDQVTDDEEWAFRRQLEIAEERELPVIVHAPHGQAVGHRADRRNHRGDGRHARTDYHRSQHGEYDRYLDADGLLDRLHALSGQDRDRVGDRPARGVWHRQHDLQ